VAFGITHHNCYLFADTMNQLNKFLLRVQQIQLLTLMFKCEILCDIISKVELPVTRAILSSFISLLLTLSLVI